MAATEQDRPPSMRRVPSFSRQTSIATLTKMARWQKLLCAGVFFTSGILCGHVIHQMFLWKFDVQHPVRDIRQVDSEYTVTRKAVSVPGANRRKDFGVQFRDYIPGHYFINCGGTFPSAVELFLETYPKASDYRIITFLADVSYAPLYVKFKNHRLFTPVAVTGHNGTTDVQVRELGSATTRPRPLPGLDLAAYMAATLNDDDYVVLLLDVSAEQERQVAKQLVAQRSVELVDRYYTTSTSGDIIGSVEKAFSNRGLKVMTWSSSNLSYSDFEQLHPLQAPPGAGKLVDNCSAADNDHVVLFLYATAHTPEVMGAVEVLLDFTAARPSKVPASVFLPASLLTALGHERLQRLYTAFEGGLYLGPVTPEHMDLGNSSWGKGAVSTSTRLQNIVAGVELRFQEAGLRLEHVMTGPELGQVTSQMIKETRRLDVFQAVDDITYLVSSTHGPTPLVLPPHPLGRILGVDLTWPGAASLALVLLQQYEPRMLGPGACLKS